MKLPALLLLLLAGAASERAVLARVDEATITRADVDERRRILGARGRNVPASDIVADLVNDALLAAEARRRGLDRDPVVADQLGTQRRRLVSDAYLGRIAEKARPSDAELREMYHATTDVVRLKLVKLATRAEAQAALARVQAGGDIESEAAQSLDRALAARRGDTGPVVRAALPAPIAAEAFRVPTGTIIGPLELSLGWAIAELVERRVASEADFPARRESIAAFAREQTMSQAKQHLLEQLRSRAQVTLDEPFLASIRGRSDLSPAELDHVVAIVNGRRMPYREIYPTVTRIFGAVGGHGASAAVSGIVLAEVESRLLADDAVARGYDRDPSVLAVLPAIERNVLASALVARLSGSGDARGTELQALLDALRPRSHVEVDRTAVAALEKLR